MNKQKVTIKKDDINPEPFEVIASSIIELSDAWIKAKNTRLEHRAILLLMKDITGLPMGDIDKVLNAIPLLKTTFIKKTPKP